MKNNQCTEATAVNSTAGRTDYIEYERFTSRVFCMCESACVKERRTV